MSCLEERNTRGPLFYGLTIVGPTSSIYAAKLASSDDQTSDGRGSSILENCQRNLAWQSISFKTAFTFLLVSKTQPIQN